MKNHLYDTAFLFLLLLAFSIQQPASIAASYGLCGIYILIALDRVSISKAQIYLYLAGSIIFSLAILNFNHGLTSALYLLSLPLTIFSAKIFGDKSHEHVISCLRNAYWLFVLGIAVGLVVYWDELEPLGAIFPGTSTNGLPSYLIVVQIAFSIAFYLKYHRLPLCSATTTLVVATFGLGRGSIMISSLILLFSLLINVCTTKSNIERRTLLIAGSLLILLSTLYVLNNYDVVVPTVDLLIQGSKFSGGILDEHRARMLADYMDKINAWTLIFGVNYSGTSIADVYGGNPHNSFIRMHSFYGLAGPFLITLSLVMIAISSRRRTYKIITLFLIMLALLRAATEPIFFPSTLDFFYFLYIVIFFNYAERRYRPRTQYA